MTIRQLAQGCASTDDDHIKVDGVEVHNVTIVGKIVSVQDSNMRLTMVVSDGTGEAELLHWLQEDTEWAAANKKAEWQPGVYIRAYGHVAGQDQKKSITAFSVRTITNFNEVTYHFLRCIFEHLHLTKGGAGGAPQAAGASMSMAPPAAGGWQGGQQAGGPPSASTFAGSAATNGMNPCQAAVLELIQSSNSDSGMHVQQIYNTFTGKFGKQAIDTALQNLTAEAHLYTTTDDDHFKAA
eukprot:GHRR01028208.1.p1 GENE.GHRR01028208.1~~GHRR01028208.1.p1  ORF type:complete len:239 (+),score=99.47 GHRR01028208.1:701-1417(+)